ncbi:ubiquinol-cytochrome c reductase iron-sulfur subunit [Kovacikia minuta CCNUW1]|uniref:QcrA and Rieske domain-containing protein n=1 Tax=Kovacikia minuta TaxID=2931930 RepID=UPI001CCFCDCB|nr:ubiquinol-cytochrome c reductase iron-sulfur subunit [Kovacikia minuta]UBF27515.1 ubiquinol-cytochrome c reductase iron-sulfur subunit [Kovacikia minuta CCNUW1]
MKRRDFINWVGLGWLASSLPVAIAACTPQGPKLSAYPPPVTELDTAGFVRVKVNDKIAIIIRDPATPSKILALSSTCTHKGCSVDWKADQKAFVCPCHQARFAPDGKVLRGPAEKPLPVYTAKVVEDKIQVTTA